MLPPGDKPNLHNLPPELLRWTSSFLDSSSALALATVHPGTQTAAEHQLWTSLKVSLPVHYGQHPWDESLPYPPSFHPCLTRQFALRERLLGILEALRADPARSTLVKELYLEAAAHSAVEMIDLLASLAEQLETLSLCPRTEDVRSPSRSKAIMDDLAYPQVFFDLLATRALHFPKLTTLTLINRKSYLYLVNLQRLLGGCPNLVDLTIKGGHKGLPSPAVGVLPPLPKLERLNIVGTRLEPFEFVDDLLNQPNALRHLRIVDKGHVGMDRATPGDAIPITIRLEPLTARLRACETLKSVEWRYKSLSLGEVVRLDETLAGPFRNVEKIWMTSDIYTVPLARLEFVEILPLPNLRELYILHTPIPETKGHARYRRLQTPSQTTPDGFLPRVLESIRNAPRLEKIYLPDITGDPKTKSKDNMEPREIGGKHAGALIRSYLHPVYGELVVVRVHTKSREHYEDLSTVFPAAPAEAIASTGVIPRLRPIPDVCQNQNSPPVRTHLYNLGVPAALTQYAVVPRWVAQQVNTRTYGPGLANDIIFSNYGPTSTNPITFGPNGPALAANPAVNPSASTAAGMVVPANGALSIGKPPQLSASAGNSAPAPGNADGDLAFNPPTMRPKKKAPGWSPPQPSPLSNSFTPQEAPTMSGAPLHPPVAEGPEQLGEAPPSMASVPSVSKLSEADSVNTAPQQHLPPVHPTHASPTLLAPVTIPALLPAPAQLAPVHAEPQNDKAPLPPPRSYSPPPTSSIGTHWDQTWTSIHQQVHPSTFNPHASAVAAVAALNAANAANATAASTAPSSTGGVASADTASSTAPTGATVAEPAESKAPGERNLGSTPALGSSPAAPSATSSSSTPSAGPSNPAAAAPAPAPSRPRRCCCPGHVRALSPPPPADSPFEVIAAYRLNALPTFQLNPGNSYPTHDSYTLTPRDSLPANPTVIFNSNAARLYYTPPDYPFPPFIPPDRSYDVQTPVVRSFVEHEWHWEEYALFNGRILGTEILAAWRAAVGLPVEWRETGRGLEMGDDAWRVLVEWEEQRKAAWVVRRAQMRERRSVERAEEMAKLGREVKGKGRAPASPSPIAPPILFDETEPLFVEQPLVPLPLPPRGGNPGGYGAQLDSSGSGSGSGNGEASTSGDATTADGERAAKRFRRESTFAIDEPGPSRYASPDEP